MKVVKVENLTPGMKLSIDIKNENDVVILRKDRVLTLESIEKIKYNGFREVYIEDNLRPDIVFSEKIPSILREKVNLDYRTLNINGLIKDAKNIFERIRDNFDISYNIYNNIENYSNRAISVAEFNYLIGRKMGYNNEKLEKLVTVSLLYDIGMVCEDNPIFMNEVFNNPLYDKFNLQKKGFNLIHNSIYSFILLSGNPNIEATMKQSILYHHENYDGSGILGINNQKVYDFAKILRITDAYFIIINSIKDSTINMKDIRDFYERQSGKMFDEKIVKIFMSEIPLYPPGRYVVLNNLEVGMVFKNNKNADRPILIMENGTHLDLSQNEFSKLYITGIVNDKIINEKKI